MNTDIQWSSPLTAGNLSWKKTQISDTETAVLRHIVHYAGRDAQDRIISEDKFTVWVTMTQHANLRELMTRQIESVYEGSDEQKALDTIRLFRDHICKR